MMITEPLEIKNIMLQNRIVMPPMDRASSMDGLIIDDLIGIGRAMLVDAMV